MSRPDPRPDTPVEDIPDPLIGGDSTPDRRRMSETSKEGRAVPPPTPVVLRSLETRHDLLRARGLPIPPLDLAGPYARHLVGRTLSLSPAPEGETGFDARDPWGARYRIVGHRDGMEPARVQVPGIPDRCFDRIVLVEFGEGFGVRRTVMAENEPFLRSAEYRENANVWTLPVDHDFWTDPEVEDLTLVLRTTAAQIERRETPFSESRSTARPYGARRRDGRLPASEA